MKRLGRLIVSGSSLSRCPWITWKDLLIEDYRPKEMVDLTVRGAGNIYVIYSVINALRTAKEHTLVAIMLTSVDKFDWWMRSDLVQEHRAEKHPPTGLDGKSATGRGFWMTGSHFPGRKEIYRDNFYDLDWQITQQITAYMTLQKICQDQNISLMLLADSPVMSVTEQELNRCGKDLTTWQEIDYNDLMLSQVMLDHCRWDLIDPRGLLGFARDRSMPDWSAKYGTHPPSGVHRQYYSDVIDPWCRENLSFQKQGISDMTETMITRMDQDWQNQKF